MIIATAGHVDHGKTLLVRQLTGIETDRLAEEKARGLTIDLGFAYVTDEFDNRLGFVDVPGHTRFINNMLAGVSAIDYALLVVAADDGPMPQTREHLAILDLLGISDGVVVISKIDRVDPERVDEVAIEVANLLAGSSLEGADILPVSGLTGDGIEDLRIALAAAAETHEQRRGKGFFRLAVDRCFSVKGAGLVVTGSVFSGTVSIGDELTLYPRGEPVRVRALHRQNEEADEAGTGDRCAINLTGRQLTRELVSRGDWLSSNPDDMPSNRVDMQLRMLGGEGRALRNGTMVHVHAAASRTLARVAILDKPNLPPGESGLIQLVLETPLHLAAGDRLVLRDTDASRTLGGGTALDPYPPARGRAKPERITHLARLASQPGLATYVEGHAIGTSIKATGAALNLTPAEIEAATTDLTDIIRTDDILISATAWQTLADHLVARLAEWHRENPQSRGISAAEARRLLPRRCSLHRALLDDLVASERLSGKGKQYSLPGYVATVSDEAEKIWAAAEPLLREGGIRPPVLHDLAATLGQEPKRVDRALKECMKAGYVFRPVENRYFVPEAMNELRELLREAAGGEPFSVKQYRDVSGIGRNLTIEILEYFDRQKVTRRLGDLREIL